MLAEPEQRRQARLVRHGHRRIGAIQPGGSSRLDRYDFSGRRLFRRIQGSSSRFGDQTVWLLERGPQS
jgi:hypothetical protein